MLCVCRKLILKYFFLDVLFLWGVIFSLDNTFFIVSLVLFAGGSGDGGQVRVILHSGK